MLFLKFVNLFVEEEFSFIKNKLTGNVGLSSRTINNYSKEPIKSGSRKYTQLHNRFKSTASKDRFSFNMSGLFENINQAERGELEEPIVKSIFEYYYEGLLNNGSISVNEAKNGHPFFYLMSMYDDAMNPYRFKPYNIDETNIDTLKFPYNRFDLGALKFHFFDLDVNSIHTFTETMISSSIAMVAALHLDIRSMEDGINFEFKDSSFSDLSVLLQSDDQGGYFFKRLRSKSGFRNNEFYRYLESYYPNIEPESIKKNYERWCKGGPIKECQWNGLISAFNDSNTVDVRLLLRSTHALYKAIYYLKELMWHFEVSYSNIDFIEDFSLWSAAIYNQYER